MRNTAARYRRLAQEGDARLRNRLRRDLGDRFREVGIDAGHMLVWHAFEELTGQPAAVPGPVPTP